MFSLSARVRQLRGGLRRELIRNIAVPVLVLRAAEGLGLWIVFDLVYMQATRQHLLVHFSLIAYFIANLALALLYLRGRVSLGLVLCDIAVNLIPVTVVVHASGGVVSPLALFYVVKVGGYVLIFGVEIGMVSLMAMVAAMAGSFVLDLMEIWRTTPLERIPPPLLWRVDVGARLGFVLLALVGGWYLLRQVRRQEVERRLEVEKSRAEAGRIRNAYDLAVPQVVVSEAISRLTTLRDVVSTVVQVVPKIINVDYAGVFVWDAREECYRGGALSGVDQESAESFRHTRLTPEQAPDLEWVRRLGKCTVVPGIPTPLGAESPPATLLAPLQGDEFFGILFFARRPGEATFTQHDISVADGVAPHVAVAMERASLIESGQRLVQALRSTGECVLITDAAARIVYVNPAFLRTFKYTSEEILGRDGLSLTPGLSGHWIADVTAAVRRGGWRGEITVRRRDGSEIVMMLDTSLIEDADGEVRGVVAIMEDMSERNRVQEQMQRADRLATAGEMAAGIAHEVNNALVGILRQAKRAHAEADPEALRDALHQVEAQGNRIAEITRGLLDFARPRQPARRETSVSELVGETLALQRYELDRAGIAVSVDIPADTPPVFVDPKQIQQVLVNLVTNAEQALADQPDRRLSITARSDGTDVVLDVEDNGPGIQAERTSRVFDPFFTTKTSGTGLGLTVSDRIIRGHGGEMSVQSESGRTVFTIRLPAIPDGRGHRALVVDDDPAVAETLVEMLSEQGVRADSVGSGTAALDRLWADPAYDVVFLDVRLPDISGPEVFKRLAETQPQLARRVVFVTGGLWRGGNNALRDELPPQPILAKPCTPDDLRQVLGAV